MISKQTLLALILSILILTSPVAGTSAITSEEKPAPSQVTSGDSIINISAILSMPSPLQSVISTFALRFPVIQGESSPDRLSQSAPEASTYAETRDSNVNINESSQKNPVRSGSDNSTYIVLLNDTNEYIEIETLDATYSQKTKKFKQTKFYRHAVEKLTTYASLGSPQSNERKKSDDYLFFLNAIIIHTTSDKQKIKQLPFVKEVWDGNERVRLHATSANTAANNWSMQAIKKSNADGKKVWKRITDSNWGYTETGIEKYHNRTSYRGAGVEITVIDTGFDTEHPLYNPLYKGDDYRPYHINVGSVAYLAGTDSDDPRGHGTGDLGIVWQAAPNAVYHVAKLQPYEVLNERGVFVELGEMTRRFEYAKQTGSEVITTSISTGCDAVPDGTSKAAEVAAEAADEDTIVVAAGGNGGCDYPAKPSTGKNVISVTGTHLAQDRQVLSAVASPASATSEKPNLAAPGAGVTSLTTQTKSDSIDDVKYTQKYGSSFAAPHVAGIAALLTRLGDASDIRESMYDSAISIPIQFSQSETRLDGAGRVSLIGTVGHDNLRGTNQVPEPETRIINSSISSGLVRFKIKLNNRGESVIDSRSGVHFRLSAASIKSVAKGAFEQCVAAPDISANTCEKDSSLPPGVVELYTTRGQATSGIITADIDNPKTASVNHRGWIRDGGDTTYNPYSNAYQNYIARSPDENGEISPKNPAPQSLQNPPFARAYYDNEFDLTEYPTKETRLSTPGTTLQSSINEWNIGDIPIDESRQTPITVTNAGDVSTEFTISGGAGLSFSKKQETVEAGDSDTFTVTIDSGRYDGSPIIITYSNSQLVIPISTTIINSEERTEEESESLPSSQCFPLTIDVWGPESGFRCDGDSSPAVVDTIDIDETEYNGFVDSTLTVEFATDKLAEDAQLDPLDVYVNGNKLSSLESPPGGGETTEKSVDISKSDIKRGKNEIRLETTERSEYDIKSGTEFSYSYLEEADLDLSLGEYPQTVEVGDSFRVPVTIQNDGGQSLQEAGVGLGSYDNVEVLSWPYADPDSRVNLAPGQTDARFFELRLADSTQSSVEIKAFAEDGQDDDETITIEPPNDPPRLKSYGLAPKKGQPNKEFEYVATVTDPDGDAVDVTLEVYDPTTGTWRTYETKQIDGDGTIRFMQNPFDVADENSKSKFRFQYSDQNDHTGTWGPFSGPVIGDDDTTGPSFSEWSYPSSVEPSSQATISVDVSDPAGVNSVVLRYAYSDSAKGEREKQMEQSGEMWRVTIPTGTQQNNSILFESVATDGDNSPVTSISRPQTILISSASDDPVADAGPDQTVTAGKTVELNASGSTALENSELTYAFQQVSRSGSSPDVSLQDPETRTPEFTAPNVDSETTVTFELTVTNSAGTTTTDTDTDQVNITITPADDPLPTTSLRFTDQTTSSGSSTLSVDTAQFGNQTVPGEKFVVVVHKTTESTYDDEIGPKVGESDVLSPGTQQSIEVDLSRTLGPSDDIAELTKSQSLVAMLHRADTDDGDNINHGSHITRNGDKVTSRAQITVDNSPPLRIPAENALAVNGSRVYTIADDSIRVYNLDTRELITQYAAPDGTNQGLAYGDGSLWYSDADQPAYNGQLLELNPTTGEIRSRIDGLGYDPYGLAYGDGSLWAGEVTGVPNELKEYSPDGSELGGSDIEGPAGSSGPNGVAYFNGSLWIGASSDSGQALFELGTNGNLKRTVQERSPESESGFRALAGSPTALYGPDSSGNLSVLVSLPPDGDGDDSDELLSVPFKTSFETGLNGWTVNQRFRTGERREPGAGEFPQSILSRGDGEYSDQYDGSVRLGVNGGPSSIGVARNTSGIQNGTQISAKFNSDSFSGEPGRVRLLLYPPGEGNQNEIGLDSRGGQSDVDEVVLSGTVSEDYPPGTQIRLTADVWPGEYDIYVTNISAQVPADDPLPTTSLRFTDQTLPNGSSTVTVDTAQFGNESVPGEKFVVVVHKTTESIYDDEIGPKVGESDVLSPGTRQSVEVDLSQTLGPSDDMAELTESQSLVAMLHRADTTDGDDVTHGAHITRDGDKVTSRAQLTVSSSSPPALRTHRNLTSTEVTNGSTVTVTVEANFESSIDDAKLEDSVDGPGITRDNITIIESDGAFIGGEVLSGPTVDATYNDRVNSGLGSDNFTVEYEVTIPEDTPVNTTITFDGTVTNDETSETAGIDGDSSVEVVATTTPDTVTVGNQEVPAEFTSETENGERTVTVDNVFDAVDELRGGDIDVDTIFSLVDAFRSEKQL